MQSEVMVSFDVHLGEEVHIRNELRNWANSPNSQLALPVMQEYVGSTKFSPPPTDIHMKLLALLCRIDYANRYVKHERLT